MIRRIQKTLTARRSRSRSQTASFDHGLQLDAKKQHRRVSGFSFNYEKT